MAQVNIGEKQPHISTEDQIQFTDQQVIEEPVPTPSDKIVGLTPEELNDPNKITISISDKQAPIVVLFGQPACGKTMTLVRLYRYLTDHGYVVEPVRDFRPTYDKNYNDICDNFHVMMNQGDAATSTSKISFLLVKVSRNGRTICQILEAPGEYYFNPEAPNAPFPKYFSAITASSNRKVWCFFVEPNWGDVPDRRNYVSRIEKLKTRIKSQDSTIIVYNKIDDSGFLIDGDGHVHLQHAKTDINNRYPNLFEKFRNSTPIVRWFSPYRCEFIPFQTGYYPKAADGTIGFQQGPDIFPQRFWNLIMKKVRG